MPLPTEPIGSIPRPPALLKAIQAHNDGTLAQEDLHARYNEAIQDTIERFEETGSPVITDGEQAKPSFATYPIEGAPYLAPDGIKIPFDDGHVRQLPRLAEGPFHYRTYAVNYLTTAQKYAHTPVKQAVISASALSLLYPEDGLDDYSRDAFLDDLVDEAERDVRRCLEAGAHAVQIDFTEGRLAVKLDPSGDLLRSFVDLNNRVLDRFTEAERARIGVHTCPGGDKDSTHSADVDYAGLLPDLFQIDAGRFYMQFASEDNQERVLEIVRDAMQDDQTVFLGVIDVNDPRIESPEEVRDTVLRAADVLPVDRLGTTDDCGFSPFGDDRSTARDTAFAKIEARVEGTAMAAEELGV